MDNSKKPWVSKTVWVNLIVALAAFVPEVNLWIEANPEYFGHIVAAVNIALRFITKEKISLS